MSVVHRTVTVEHAYRHPPAAVFAAWADGEVKRRWFDLTDGDGAWHSDFRVGGREHFRGPRHTYEGRYCDIVDGERIVLLTEVGVDGRRASVTLTTVELTPVDDGTRLVVTEQGAYLDGLEEAATRAEGVRRQLDRLAGVLDRDPRALA